MAQRTQEYWENRPEVYQMTFSEFSDEYNELMPIMKTKEGEVGKLDLHSSDYVPMTEEEIALHNKDWKAFSHNRGFSEMYGRWHKITGQTDDLEYTINDPWRRTVSEDGLYLRHIEYAKEKGIEISREVEESYMQVHKNLNAFESYASPKEHSEQIQPEYTWDDFNDSVWDDLEYIPENQKTFDEIINQVTIDELRNPPKTDERNKNIATFARFVANGHAGWNSFSDDVKNSFKTQVEQLYNRGATSNEDLLKEFETLLIKTIPDNHTIIYASDGKRVLTEEQMHSIEGKAIEKLPVTSVGKNTAYTAKSGGNCELLCHQGGNEHPITISQKTDKNGKKIGIISLSKCPQPDDQNYDLNAFYNTFEKNYKDWDAIVLDVRGNEGGNSMVLSDIYEKLYGEKISPYLSQTMRLTLEAKIIQDIKFPNVGFIDSMHKNPTQSDIVVNTNNERRFDEKKGYNKNIYVLTDRKTSSSAESVYALHNHPKIKYVGENTCGCDEYGDTSTVPLPNGGKLGFGVFHNKFDCGSIEGIGHHPTHPTEKGKDAFEHCEKIIDRDFRIQALREKFPSKNIPQELKAPYKPPQDLSKANFDALRMCQNKTING